MTKKKKAAKKKKKKVVTEVPPSTEVACPVCNGGGLFYSGFYAEAPDDNDCPRCAGAGTVEQSTVEAEETVECPECEGSGWGDSMVWMGRESEPDPCRECKGTGEVLKSVVDVEKKRKQWEERQAALPTEEERDLADYVSRILSIKLDQADKIVEMLIEAVNARRQHEAAWARYDG